MKTIRTKICGITNYDDAIAAIDMGADFLGFNFYPQSPRYITPQDAIKIIDKLPMCVQMTGVFVNPTLEQIRELTEQGTLDWIQLHGDEDPDFCDSLAVFNVKVIKALRVKTAQDIADTDKYRADAILFDAYDSKLYGGTGKTFDWSMIGPMPKKIFLAGGITPENVAQAVKTWVYGVDVCSGIEAEPGKKDYAKMKRLFDNIQTIIG